jgi:hypothetical protein
MYLLSVKQKLAAKAPTHLLPILLLLLPSLASLMHHRTLTPLEIAPVAGRTPSCVALVFVGKMIGMTHSVHEPSPFFQPLDISILWPSLPMGWHPPLSSWLKTPLYPEYAALFLFDVATVW